MPQREKQNKSRTLRISLLDHDSHEELFALPLPRLHMVLALVGVVLLVALLTWALVAFTPLRTTVPGYPSAESRATAIENKLKIDSLEKVIDLWAYQVGNIQRIMTGREPLDLDSLSTAVGTGEVSDYYRALYASSDSVLRGKVLAEDELTLSSEKKKIEQIEGLHYFSPVQGMVSEPYNKALNHPFVDITAADDAPVYAILDGAVVSAYWNDITGYTIQMQHDNNLISIYRNCAELFYKSGDNVKAGTPIAVAGNAGAHLQFELWHKGEAIDPAQFIKF